MVAGDGKIPPVEFPYNPSDHTNIFRSGNLYYKQNLLRSCCPHYTLRLEASAYRPRRDQRKAINKWNKFILGPEYMRKVARLCPQTREYAILYLSIYYQILC